jgi:hypothetical protein
MEPFDYQPATSFGAGITMNGTTFNNGSGTTAFSASQNLAGSSSMTFAGTATIGSGFTLTNNNTGTVQFATITGGSGTSSLATGSGSYTKVTANPMATGTIVPSTSTNTFEYSGATATVIAPTTNNYYHLTLSGTGTATITSIAGTTGNLTLSGASTAITPTSTFAVGGLLTVGVGTTFHMGNVALTVTGATSVSGTVDTVTGSTGARTFTGAVTVNSGGVWDLSGQNPTTSFAAGITASGTTFNNGTGTATFTATESLLGVSAMTFGTGAINNTFTLSNGDTSTVTFSSNITGAGSSANFATGTGSTTKVAGTVMTTGTLTPATSANTFEYNGGAQTVKVPTTNPYYHLTFSGSGTKSLAGTTSVTGTTTVTAGTLDTVSGSNALTLGTLSIGASGIFRARSSAISVTGDWTNSGVFTADTSTVTFSGTGQQNLAGTMTASSAFYNLTITNNSGTDASDNEITSFVPSVIFSTAATSTNNYVVTTASVRVQYHTGSAYTFTNVNWNGQATGTKIYFRNSATSGTWTLVVSGTETGMRYLNVSRSDASTGSLVVVNDGTSFDAGNNTHWQFAIVSITVSSSGTISYGAVPLSGSKDTLSLSNTQVLVNSGTVTSSFSVHGQNTSCAWTLASVIGANQYKHEFSTNGGTSWTPLTTSYQTLASGVTAGGTSNSDFKITVPSSTSCTGSQAADITILVTQD